MSINSGDISRELKDIYEADQSDRRNWEKEELNWEVIKPRDETRLSRVKELYMNGLLQTSEDLFYGAMIFQHGNSSEDYLRAMELAKKSMELANEEAKYLYPKTEDRYLLSLGKPQIWGTQYIKNSEGAWELKEPFDSSAKTDEERNKFGIDIKKGLKTN